MPNEKVALVAGCTTGIGYPTSLMLARNGDPTHPVLLNPLEQL
jgi:NAD(P)-dependent dehydrogenase (short-subunit alcohol dehydrogenase family)